MLNYLDAELYTCKVPGSVRDRQYNLAQTLLSEKPQDTGNLLETLMIKVGARVMLTGNVDVLDGLTNGTYETISNIVSGFTQTNGTYHVEAILVIFDNETFGMKTKLKSRNKNTDPKAVPMMRTQVILLVKGRKSFQASRTPVSTVPCLGNDNS